MENPEFQVTAQDIRLKNAWHPVSGTRNGYRAQFTFSPEWNGLVKTAVFRFGDNSRCERLIEGDACTVPVMPEGWLRVGVYGVSEDKRLPTVYLFESIYVERGAEEGAQAEVAPSQWEAFVAAVHADAEAARSAARTAAQEAAEEAAAEVFGEIAGAHVGDLLRVAAVDGQGKPTAFAPFSPPQLDGVIGEEFATGETFNGRPVYLMALSLNRITQIGLNAVSVDGTGIEDLLSVSGYIENQSRMTKITLPFFSMQTNGNVLSDVRLSAQLYTVGGARKLRFNIVLAADNNGTVIGAVDTPTVIVRYTRRAAR